jgi:hypothetical protein
LEKARFEDLESCWKTALAGRRWADEDSILRACF